MALIPAAHCLLITPSLVDNNEHETVSGITVVTNERPAHKIYRGIVDAIGGHIQQDVKVGCVAHYLDYLELGGVHVVDERSLVAWEDDG